MGWQEQLQLSRGTCTVPRSPHQRNSPAPPCICQLEPHAQKWLLEGS